VQIEDALAVAVYSHDNNHCARPPDSKDDIRGEQEHILHQTTGEIDSLATKMALANPEDDPNYNFTEPYPKPQFEYPASHSRTSLPRSGIRSPSPTPSEIEEAKEPFIPRKIFTLEFYKRPKVISEAALHFSITI
jgi:hypothetical protein